MLSLVLQQFCDEATAVANKKLPQKEQIAKRIRN
jgi:hypothetical protein